MSRAFVRESDAQEPLPERAVSPHQNLVTPEGMRQIEARIRELESSRQAARAAGDAEALGLAERDLRYWSRRRVSAQVVERWDRPGTVLFGVCVTLSFEDGAERAFRLVGEDESDPPRGLLSWASPLAQSLLGHESGDEVQFQGRAVRIVRIES